MPGTIPLDEIVPGATARMCLIENVQYISVRDLIMHLAWLSAKSANKSWERLAENMKEEVATSCLLFQFPGQGKKPEAVISFHGAL